MVGPSSGRTAQWIAIRNDEEAAGRNSQGEASRADEGVLDYRYRRRRNRQITGVAGEGKNRITRRTAGYESELMEKPRLTANAGWREERWKR